MLDFLSEKLMHPERDAKRIRQTFYLFAPCGLICGALIQCFPAAFWAVLGIDAGNAVLSRLYGCVLLSVGVLGMMAIRQPLRYASLLLFIGVYKGLAGGFLGVAYLSGDQPPAVIVIAALYFGLALYCFVIYPWHDETGRISTGMDNG